jgi:hypothetical protein
MIIQQYKHIFKVFKHRKDQSARLDVLSLAAF